MEQKTKKKRTNAASPSRQYEHLVSPRRFQVIYADPPWQYRNKKTGGSMKSGAEQKYPTMTFAEICALPIKDIAEKDSVLFLWVTTPMMEEGLAVMKAWGYRYKTKIYWRKIMSLGMGFWFRGQVEELWLCTRGKVKAFRCQVANHIQTKVLRHSEKPEEFRILIEKATAQMPRRVELFARKKTDGWDVFGNEVESTITLTTNDKEK
jgi:N6-adenosine-specific RNA methylase IME4